MFYACTAKINVTGNMKNLQKFLVPKQGLSSCFHAYLSSRKSHYMFYFFMKYLSLALLESVILTQNQTIYHNVWSSFEPVKVIFLFYWFFFSYRSVLTH
jgi:hypothetical protein